MALLYKCFINLTITYGMIVGTVIIVTGLVYMFLRGNPLEVSAVIGIGAAMIVGKSAIEKWAPNGNGNGCKNGQPLE